MKQKALLATLFSCLLLMSLSGCGKENVKAPACDDQRSVDLVLKLVLSRMATELTPEEAKRLDIGLDFVRATYTSDDESLFICRANLTVNNSPITIPIVYRSELDKTQANAFTVTVQDF